MKKILFFLAIFFIGITKVDAYIVINNIEISKDRTKYYINGATLTRASLADKEKFVFDERNVVNYNNKIEEFIIPYYSNLFFDGGMNDAGELSSKSALMPGELLSNVVFFGGGSSGSCRLINSELDCNNRDNPANWDMAQQINSVYLKQSYPILVDDVVAITRTDVYSPITFNKNASSFPNSIINTGTLDYDGRWVANNAIKIYESEYNNSKVDLVVRAANPFGLANLYFSKDGYKYNELSLNGKPLYKKVSEEEIEEYCSKYEPIYQKICKKVTGDKYLGSIHSIPIDKENDVIHGIWFTTFLGSNENLKINAARQKFGNDGFGGIYEFEIPIEVVPDPDEKEVSEKENEKETTGIHENNAKIFIDNKEVNIKNLKDYDLGRIYVSLDEICKNVETCKFEQRQDENGETFYRISRKILNTEIKFVLIHYPETKTFETTVFKNNEKLNYDIISPAAGYIDAGSKILNNALYVPIRFLLEGLGANITYVSAKGNEYPEEVHISFTDTVDIKIESNTLEKDNNKTNNYTTNVNKNYINFTSSIEGTKSFYAFQLEKNNAPILKSDNGNYNNIVEFPNNDKYKYLIVNKTKNNGSEFMAYQIFNLEFIK